ncbi:MAG: UvrD-helicase domain-containing protein [Clostridiales bacterium]|jgi:DNA helicase-2/ATP-dependent DNA helicase PcrA|nr:UvrD-helicase domain-containing protein [Clostridiales bacterium]
MNSLLSDNLNKMQKMACEHTLGPLLILAGAGSGKTRVLTYRTANLLENGVNPENIIAITFTNKAAAEMRERISNLCPEGKRVWVSTFHSACVRILRREINALEYNSQFTIYDADDSVRLVKNCMRELNKSEKAMQVKAVLSQIGKFKDELLSPSEALKLAGNFFEKEVAEIYERYQKILKSSNALDFDDIISKTVELFTLRPDILERYQDKFKYIMVDEYQDTNTAQYHLIRVLAQKHRNICVVGDDDQSIYGWRGANIRNILDFEKQYPDAFVIKLEQNYRSTQNILNVANSVIKNNPNRKAKNLWTEGEEGEKIQFYQAESDYDEARFIVNEVKRMQEEGEVFSNFAVLYRVNATSRVLEEAFVKNSVPYKIFGGVNFYGRREIKDVLAYLKLIYNKYDGVAFERIINVPRRGIGDSSIEKIRSHAEATGMHLFDAASDAENIYAIGRRAGKITDFTKMINGFSEFAQTSNMETLIDMIITSTKYKEELLADDEDEEARERVENINSLISKAHEYDESAENPNLADFLQEVSLVADIDSLNEGDSAVSLMTLHNCKGLEFPCVFIAGFEEGLLPGYRSISNGNEAEIEEERRICYVGITRAKKKLYLSAAKKRMQAGMTNYNPPSRFYGEIAPNLVTVISASHLRGSYFGQASGLNDRKMNDSALLASSPKISAVTGEIRQEKHQSYSYRPTLSKPKKVTIDFEVGDNVSHIKYGKGEVLDIYPAGADYEVTIKFQGTGIKKMMAYLAKLKKV